MHSFTLLFYVHSHFLNLNIIAVLGFKDILIFQSLCDTHGEKIQIAVARKITNWKWNKHQVWLFFSQLKRFLLFIWQQETKEWALIIETNGWRRISSLEWASVHQDLQDLWTTGPEMGSTM